MSKPQFTDAECPLCNTSFDRLPVDYDEDGNGAALLEVTACAQCGALLCSCCPQFHCDACGERVCLTHLVEADGLKQCGPCSATGEPAELPEALPPARETRIAAASGMEVA